MARWRVIPVDLICVLVEAVVFFHQSAVRCRMSFSETVLCMLHGSSLMVLISTTSSLMSSFNPKSEISGYKYSGRCSSTVESRLLRFWEAENVKRGGELMWIDMLMVDVNGDQQSMSRKHWMMTYMCLSPALVTNAYTFVYVQNAAALDKKPEVYCNCQSIDYMCGAIGKWKALNRKGSKDVYEFTECPNCYPLANNKGLLRRPGAHELLDTMYNGRLLLNSRAEAIEEEEK
ncbi:uncharacterized protein LOC108861093 isoform X2 [Raphanus sativus]|uniref:Uncharacterized protein LOC108861093 isoform X2 n=1 Tax=Raphanus sativus TaxID=3726 RepID=A0A9W3DSN2_RAPSA|nr:uncharacterized protein LOC130507654 isoform X2 [Raphanus sativus]XP_056866830.1 uncharacterized protein LOC108861093 isoform X2 [Raphanus sativus]